MQYQRTSFTVPVSDSKPRTACAHGWVNQLGRCQWCNEKVAVVPGEADVVVPSRTAGE